MPEQYLFLYEWAGLAVELKPDMSAADVELAQADRVKHANGLDEQSIVYPWVIETG